ncbi:glycosyltransferase family 4 protein [uncultured Bacteroides sp.]|uniref:glycosyltransferase family 4 protein n=1 Tax=uncultured Bacteroides sp. TaxID=162156 RepID=UPI002AAAD380|nr:glycosyltransferase family 4 protein [uncultured Bacteroides sp.]
MKVKISSFTPLFFPYTAKYVSYFSDVTFIQGFIPNRITKKILQLFDLFFKTSVTKRLSKRVLVDSKGKNIGLFLPEIYMIIGMAISKNKSLIQARAHFFYGWWSKRYLSNLDILHVRSGSGRGGAIQRAKENNAIVIVDHSIAHPNSMRNILLEEYIKYHISYEFSNRFWDQIVEDCKEADYILVNSDFVKKSFVENGYKSDRIKVIYLGVRDDFFGCKTKYKTSKVLNLLFIGAFGFRKGCEYLLKSLELIEKKDIDFKLTVIGPIDNFQSVIENYDSNKIDFRGRVLYDDLKKYYAASDVFIFPSLCEGSTMAGMEAMAAGMPCIFTENCGVPIVDRENALIVPIKNEQAIADAVEILYKSESLREKIGLRAAETIKNNYKWADYQNNLNIFYNEVIHHLN